MKRIVQRLNRNRLLSFLVFFTVLAVLRPAYGALAAEQVPAEAEQTQTGAEQPSFFPLMDESGVSIRLYDVRQFDNGARKVFFRITNTREESVRVTMQDFCLNGTIYMENTGSKEVKAGQSVDYEALFLSYAFTEAGRDGAVLSEFRMKLKVVAGQRGRETVLFDDICAAQYPEGYTPQMVCEPAFSALAKEQILLEDDDVRVTLEALGCYAGSDPSWPLQGIVKVENLSNSTIPVYLQNCRLNGYTIKAEGGAGGRLSGGSTLYIAFKCSKRNLSSSRITAISDVALQIMTSESENTATTQSHAGGTWYPVVLSEYGIQEGAPEEGELLYEDEYVRIGLLGQSAEYSKYSSQTQFQWELSFVNKKDMDLEIRFSDFYIDGVKEDTSLLYAYVMEAVVGAGARTNHRMLHFVDGDQPLPEVSFRVRVQAAGSGALYNYSEKRVTIKPQ